MRIWFERLVLEGYGRFGERREFRFTPGFNLITGANESGKSTLLSALLDALYTNPATEAREARERIHWRHPTGWRLELSLQLGDTPVRIAKFHPKDSPRRYAEFHLQVGQETLAGSDALSRWEQLWSLPREVYCATACVRQRELALLARDRALASLQQQLRQSALAVDLEPILKAIRERKKQLATEQKTLAERLNAHQKAYLQAKQSAEEYQRIRTQLAHNRERLREIDATLQQESGILERWKALYTQRQRLSHLQEQVKRAFDWLHNHETLQAEKQRLESQLAAPSLSALAQLPDGAQERIRTLHAAYRHAREQESQQAERLKEAQQALQQAMGQARARRGLLAMGLALMGAGALLLQQGERWAGFLGLGLGALALLVSIFWRSRTLAAAQANAQVLQAQLEAQRAQRRATETELMSLLQQAGVMAPPAPLRNGAEPDYADEIARAYTQLETLLQQRETLENDLRTVQNKLDALATMGTYDSVKEQYRAQSVEIASLEAALRNDPIAHELSQIPAEQMAQREARLQELQAERERLQAECHRLEGRLDALTLQTDPDELALLIERDTARQRTLAQQLEVLELTESLLKGANENYLRDLSPHLKPRIEAYLPALTQNRYTQVQLGNDLEMSVYHTERGEPLPLDEKLPAWSAGTLDQLFFACRLGLCEALSGGARLPLLLDDPLVYADEWRLAEAFALLERLATETQVLYFTCRAPADFPQEHVIALDIG